MFRKNLSIVDRSENPGTISGKDYKVKEQNERPQSE